MKVLIVTTSRADWNGLGMVVRELNRRDNLPIVCAICDKWPEWEEAILEDAKGYGAAKDIDTALYHYKSLPDVALVAGDRSELLKACIDLCKKQIPIAHIAGGDITQGSMDDRYRDAISMLASVHFPSNPESAHMLDLMHVKGKIVETGSPAIDRIKKIGPQAPTFIYNGPTDLKRVALLQVHSNTIGDFPLADWMATLEAVLTMPELFCMILGANADDGGEMINDAAHALALENKRFLFYLNLPPSQYYWLLQNCGVLVGNSSAGAYEAPCFGIPVVNVGDRQKGRLFGARTWHVPACKIEIANAIKDALYQTAKLHRGSLQSRYGDGNSAPRIVDALEAWHNEVSARRQDIRHGQGDVLVQG